MATYYTVLIGVLFFLALSDLIVGVSNDAVNFLNSAIGSKAGSFKTIMLFASAGIFFGAIFSSGMMEVARKGIFHPQYFYFSEIMIIFLAVMLADIILLDLFNTFGMPTSTTVSIVFDLLGAAVGMALIKIYHDPNHLGLGEYINTQKAMAIISGILLSVVISLLAGAIIQYFVRLIFTFDYQPRFKKYGAIWGALSFSGIAYFVLIKGIKGAHFIDEAFKKGIKEDWMTVIVIIFFVALVVFWFLQHVLKVNILRIIVLLGTFSLATAFASNDLVNFIGVPMAAYNAYQFFIQANADPDTFLMSDLAKKVPIETWMLMASGLVMVLTLWFSRKARSVTETEVNLGRQEEGYERFGSNLFARVLVQMVIDGHKRISSVIPAKLNNAIAQRFSPQKWTQAHSEDEEVPHFDMLRASVNILVAAILISIATSMKLPLSTTYVTFMVAMGTSLSDRAWGRESAVYRVSGVLAVIGGWFFTALFAFTMAFTLVNILYFGGKFAVFGMLIVAAFVAYQTHFLHKKREEKKSKLLKEAGEIGKVTSHVLAEKSKNTARNFLSEYQRLITQTLSDLAQENRKNLRNDYSEFLEMNEISKSKKAGVSKVIDKLAEDSLESGYHYVQVLDYIRELSNSTRHLIEPALAHVENSHKPLIPVQAQDLKDLGDELAVFVQEAQKVLESEDEHLMEAFNEHKKTLLKKIRKTRKNQIRRIKNHEVGTRNSMLFFALLTELKNFTLFAYTLVKAHRGLVSTAGGKAVDDLLD